MGSEDVRRFFVTVEAPGEGALHALRAYGLDLFRGTAVRSLSALRTLEAGAPPPALRVEGLMTIAQAERLALDGYRVTLEEEASRRARAPLQVVDFDAWLAAWRQRKEG